MGIERQQSLCDVIAGVADWYEVAGINYHASTMRLRQEAVDLINLAVEAQGAACRRNVKFDVYCRQMPFFATIRFPYTAGPVDNAAAGVTIRGVHHNEARHTA